MRSEVDLTKGMSVEEAFDESREITRFEDRVYMGMILELPNVAFCGRMGAGKTTAARFLIDRFGYNRVDDSDSPVVVDDLAYPKEYWWLKERGFVICRVAADEDLRTTRLQLVGRLDDLDKLNDLSETELDGLHTDYVFTNQGEEERLHTQIIEMLYKEANRS